MQRRPLSSRTRYGFPAGVLGSLVLVAALGLIPVSPATAKGGTPVAAPGAGGTGGGGGGAKPPPPAPSGPGAAVFANPVAYAALPNPNRAAVADFNGDGQPDLAVTSSTYRQIVVLLGNADGTFGAAIRTPADINTPGLNGTVVTGDFNGDGRQDVTGIESMPVGGTFYVAFGVELGRGDGTFGPLVRDANSHMNIRPEAAADVDGDGRLDVIGPATAAPPPGSPSTSLGVAVALGNGDGTFRPAATYPVANDAGGNGALLLAAGDLNGDNRVDVAASTSSGEVDVLLNQGGAFGPATGFAQGYGATWLTIADVNGDGIADIPFDRQLNADATALLGNGNGTFRTMPVTGTGVTPAGVVAGDFNLDGKMDLFVQSNGAKAANLLYGTGAALGAPGGFGWSPGPEFRDNAGFGNIVKADFDNDGKPDIAVPNTGGKDTTITILLNRTS